MIGVWYDIANLLKGELLDDVFKWTDTGNAQKSPAVTGEFFESSLPRKVCTDGSKNAAHRHKNLDSPGNLCYNEENTRGNANEY